MSLREKIILACAIIGTLACSVLAQTKPTTVVAPSGTWADSLKRAYAFEDSGVTTITDYSSHTNATVTGTLTWTRNASNELYVQTPGTTGNFISCGTDWWAGNPPNFTIMLRFRYLVDYSDRYHSGSAHPSTDPPNDDFSLYDPTGSKRYGFRVKNTSGTAVTVYNSSSKQYSENNDFTIILSYDSDSLRYYNGVGANSYTTANHNLAIRNSSFTTWFGRNAGYYSQIGLYAVCLWHRLLTSDERGAIMADPFIMFRAIVPEIQINGNGTEIADGDATPSASDSTDFGSVNIVGGTRSVTYKIFNTGGDTLFLSDSPEVTIGGTHASDFSLTTAPADTILAGDSTSFIIKFNPSAIGTRSATLSIANTDADENPYNFAIQGTGFAIEIAVSASGINIPNGGGSSFGNVAVGSSDSITYTIANTGNTNLVLSGTPKVAISGDSDFTVSAQPSSPVAGSGSTTFNVLLTPTSTGFKTATITIENNDTDENPFGFTISANISPTIILKFGQVPYGNRKKF